MLNGAGGGGAPFGMFRVTFLAPPGNLAAPVTTHPYVCRPCVWASRPSGTWRNERRKWAGSKTQRRGNSSIAPQGTR